MKAMASAVNPELPMSLELPAEIDRFGMPLLFPETKFEIRKVGQIKTSDG
jgi:hypothetical protein